MNNQLKKTNYSWPNIIISALAMSLIVVLSNWLVTIQINDWLTWGALTFPFAFLINDLTNRAFGAKLARIVVSLGFVVGIILSLQLETRIAVASGCAFLVSQMLDIEIFKRIHSKLWWRAPIISSSISSIVDTALFFSIAFVGTQVPWISLGFGDLMIKLLVALVALIPYRVAMMRLSS